MALKMEPEAGDRRSFSCIAPRVQDPENETQNLKLKTLNTCRV